MNTLNASCAACMSACISAVLLHTTPLFSAAPTKARLAFTASSPEMPPTSVATPHQPQALSASLMRRSSPIPSESAR